LIMSGDVGRFIFSLPVVITCALVASRIVSMTFVPLLGHALLRGHDRPSLPWAERRERGVAGLYARGVRWAIDHRYLVLVAAAGVLAAGFSLGPQQDQVNYAQLVVEVRDDHDTIDLIAPLQRALSAQVPGALIDVRQLETGKPVNNPLEVRISGDDIQTLRDLSRQAQAI